MMDSINLEVKNAYAIKKDYVKRNLDNYIIQPYLEDYKLFNCNLLAVKGEVIEYLVITQANNFKRTNLFGRNLFQKDRYILDAKHPYFNRIYGYSQELMKTTEYSGFADIEFLCKDDQIYLLEINPRMSGQIFTLINSSSIYIDYLILNYIYYSKRVIIKK